MEEEGEEGPPVIIEIMLQSLCLISFPDARYNDQRLFTSNTVNCQGNSQSIPSSLMSSIVSAFPPSSQLI